MARTIFRPLCTLPFFQHFFFFFKKTSPNVQSPVEAVVTELITLDEDRLLTKQFNTIMRTMLTEMRVGGVRNRKPVSDS